MDTTYTILNPVEVIKLTRLNRVVTMIVGKMEKAFKTIISPLMIILYTA